MHGVNQLSVNVIQSFNQLTAIVLLLRIKVSLSESTLQCMRILMLFVFDNNMYHDDYKWKYPYYFTCFHSTSSVPLIEYFF